MLEALPLLVTTFVFTSVFLYIFSSVQLHDIRENWNTRRCEPLVMLIAQSVPDPKDTKTDASTFASDNFSFCINKFIDASIAATMGPMLGIFSKQIDATQPIAESLNYLKSAATNSLLNPMNTFINNIWKKFGYVLYQLVRIFVKLNSSFQRVFGILLSSVFAGMAMYKGILNTKDFIIKVCIILLNIIIALLFLLFIPLLPFIPIIIIPVITALTVAGAATGGMEGAFNCVAPGTLVASKDGWKKVETLKVGDELKEGYITGILKGIPGGTCVSINNVIISGLHIVYDIHKKQWIHASNHTLAKSVDIPPDIVYCLTTTSKTWTVMEKKGSGLLLRDWTDIPDDDNADIVMNDLVQRLLHTNVYEETSKLYRGISVLCGSTNIFHEENGSINMKDVKLHDKIYDGTSFTEVLGIYKGRRELRSTDEIDSAWIWNQTKNRWVRPLLKSELGTNIGYTFVTQSGKFWVNGTIRRDITEIGCDRLYETGEIVLSLLNNRNDEEERFFT